MSERLKTPESGDWLVDGLHFCHPNTVQAEAAQSDSARAGFTFRDRTDSADYVRESVFCWLSQPPHQRTLHRRAPIQRVEQGETKSFCGHETHSSAGGHLERLTLSQWRWGDCDGRLEIRAHYPAGWERSSTIWLTSRSDVDQAGSNWFEVPNLSLLATRRYNPLQGLFKHRLIQTDYDRGLQTARLLMTKDQSVSGAWGYQTKVSGPIPKVDSWAPGDSLCPPYYGEKLRSLAFGPGSESDLDAKSELDGLVDCRRVAEAMRVQAEDGPVNLARVAHDTGLAGQPT